MHPICASKCAEPVCVSSTPVRRDIPATHIRSKCAEPVCVSPTLILWGLKCVSSNAHNRNRKDFS
jgi:hypothetical protein